MAMKGGRKIVRRRVRQKQGRSRIGGAFLAFSGISLVLMAVGWFNAYVNTEIRPTLMQLAEYEARSVTVQIIHTTVEQTVKEEKLDFGKIYTISQNCVQMDAAAANQLKNILVSAVQEAIKNTPEREYQIPFGSLTGNSLLSGHGPAWSVDWQPQGYVQAEWQESSESLSINTVRYSVDLQISVTVNMVLDGRTETLTTTDSIPLASVLLCGEIPNAYAAALD